MILENKQAVLNIIGKRTMMKFICIAEQALVYETVIPVDLGSEFGFNKVRLEFDYLYGAEVLRYDTLEYIFKEHHSLISASVMHPQKESEYIFEGSEDIPKYKVELLNDDYEDDIFKDVLFDAEGDELKCHFETEDTVNIDTKELTYVLLTRENLFKLLSLMDDAEKNYKLLD